MPLFSSSIARQLFTIPRLLVFSFACAVTAGALLLWMPVAVKQGEPPLQFVDALFTATSAVCVTGLVVRDTGSEFSIFGQAVILLLIQAGGIGILTFSNSLFLIRWHSFGLAQRAVMSETVGLHRNVTPTELLFQIFKFTFICEGIGAMILSLRFAADFDIPHALWLGIFHAVSAFCNAGFSLFSDSLISYRADLVVNFTVMALVIGGGLGFVVVADIIAAAKLYRSQRRRLKLTFHTRVVLRTTAILLLFGWLAFILLQLPTSNPNQENLVLESLFFSVTARTAGFNTADVSSLSNAGIMILMMLMVIGGSPGSTAGGMKTTTFATLYALLHSRAANRPRVELLDRTIPHEIQGKALAAAVVFFVTTIGATVLLELTEGATQAHTNTSRQFLPHLFEVISALATVGLSTGITADFSSPGKFILTICMFTGRLGPLIVAGSLIGQRRRIDYSYPEERLMVG